jgi:hypothetical protein
MKFKKHSIVALAFLAGLSVMIIGPDVQAAQYFVKKKAPDETVDDNAVGGVNLKDKNHSTNPVVRPAPTTRPDMEEITNKESGLQEAKAVSACSAENKIAALNLYQKFKSLENKENADSTSANEIEQDMNDPAKFGAMVNLFTACAQYLPGELYGR